MQVYLTILDGSRVDQNILEHSKPTGVMASALASECAGSKMPRLWMHSDPT